MRKKTKTKGEVGKASRRTRAYPYEFRLQIVRLYLEVGYSTSVLREQFGVSNHSVHRWARAYRQQGAEGLVSKLPPGARPKLTEAVKKRIVGVKRSHSEYGPRRIAAVLKRFFLVRASATSVHKTLSDEGLTKKAKPKPVKNPSKPRFFERSRPNQLWQSDIMTFRLGGQNAYPTLHGAICLGYSDNLNVFPQSTIEILGAEWFLWINHIPFSFVQRALLFLLELPLFILFFGISGIFSLIHFVAPERG